jgi:hypothetical protein
MMSDVAFYGCLIVIAVAVILLAITEKFLSQGPKERTETPITFSALVSRERNGEKWRVLDNFAILHIEENLILFVTFNHHREVNGVSLTRHYSDSEREDDVSLPSITTMEQLDTLISILEVRT